MTAPIAEHDAVIAIVHGQQVGDGFKNVAQQGFRITQGLLRLPALADVLDQLDEAYDATVMFHQGIGVEEDGKRGAIVAQAPCLGDTGLPCHHRPRSGTVGTGSIAFLELPKALLADKALPRPAKQAGLAGIDGDDVEIAIDQRDSLVDVLDQRTVLLAAAFQLAGVLSEHAIISRDAVDGHEDDRVDHDS